jgi:hypothetical protein
LNAILILAIENLHGLDGLRNGSSTTDQDTIDVESENERVGDRLRDGRGDGRGGRPETGDTVT